MRAVTGSFVAALIMLPSAYMSESVACAAAIPILKMNAMESVKNL
jgi:hypothetical protein